MDKRILQYEKYGMVIKGSFPSDREFFPSPGSTSIESTELSSQCHHIHPSPSPVTDEDVIAWAKESQAGVLVISRETLGRVEASSGSLRLERICAARGLKTW